MARATRRSTAARTLGATVPVKQRLHTTLIFRPRPRPRPTAPVLLLESRESELLQLSNRLRRPTHASRAATLGRHPLRWPPPTAHSSCADRLLSDPGRVSGSLGSAYSIRLPGLGTTAFATLAFRALCWCFVPSTRGPNAATMPFSRGVQRTPTPVTRSRLLQRPQRMPGLSGPQT